MVRIATMAGLSAIAIGFGVPVACIYFSVYHEFNWIAALILGVFALVAGSVLGIVGTAIGSEELPETTRNTDREKLNVIRAHQRATLEELDDIITVLKDIRDLLKAAEE